MEFTINSIKDGVVNVTFIFEDKSTVTQNIAGLVIDNAESLKGSLHAYGFAYYRGKQEEKAAVTPVSEVVDLVGEKQVFTPETLVL